MGNTYNPGPGDTLIPGAQAATELLSRVGGFIGGCGQAALAVIANLVNGTPVTPQEVTQIILDSIKNGASPASSTPAQLTATASDLGVNLQSVPWQTALARDAGTTPIEIGVSNAAAFGGPDANVAGHYITVVGKTANGNYIVSDPNTPQSENGQFVTYTPQQIANALPFWAAEPTNPLAGGAGGGVFGLPGSQAVSTWLGQIGHNLLSGIGLSSAKDALWRVGLIILAVILLIFGLVWLLSSPGGALDQGNQRAEIIETSEENAGVPTERSLHQAGADIAKGALA